MDYDLFHSSTTQDGMIDTSKFTYMGEVWNKDIIAASKFIGALEIKLEKDHLPTENRRLCMHVLASPGASG